MLYKPLLAALYEILSGFLSLGLACSVRSGFQDRVFLFSGDCGGTASIVALGMLLLSGAV